MNQNTVAPVTDADAGGLELFVLATPTLGMPGVLRSPRRYVQAPGVISRAGTYFRECCLLAMLCAASPQSWSQPTEDEAPALAARHAAVSHTQSTGHHRAFPHHTLGVFVGDTSEDRRNQGLTLGLEYEYRVNERFGLGAIIEHVAGDLDTNVAVLPLAWHRGPWKLYAGPGLEKSKEESAEFLLRVGLEYGFHFGAYELSPQVDVDFVDGEHLLIFGVTLARPF